MPQKSAAPLFLLTRHWRDTAAGLEVVLWAGGGEDRPARIHLRGQQAVCFIPRAITDEKIAALAQNYQRRRLKLKTLDGGDADAVYFSRQSDLLEFRRRAQHHGIALYESDVKPADRFLMERFITGAFTVHGEARHQDGFTVFTNPRLRRASHKPAFRVLSLDIETGRDGRLYSAAAADDGAEKVFVVNDGTQKKGGVTHGGLPVVFVRDETQLLTEFFRWLRRRDPDVLIGWNVVNFDLDVLQRACARLNVPFDIARGGERAAVVRRENQTQTNIARLPGRVVLDGIETLRAAFWNFESFRLEFVARQLLGRGKALADSGDKMGEIERLYRDAQFELAHYNLEDCRLVREIFAHTDLVNFTATRTALTGLALGRHGGSVAAFDNLYLPRLHRAGYVAPDLDPSRAANAESSPGGYVLDSRPGLYRNVLLLDFKSLYPSIIRTFKVDPLGMQLGGDGDGGGTPKAGNLMDS